MPKKTRKTEGEIAITEVRGLLMRALGLNMTTVGDEPTASLAIRVIAMRVQRIGFDDYQRAAGSTYDKTLPLRDQMSEAALGLASEAGEAANEVRKHLYQSKRDVRDVVRLELGDTLSFLARTAAVFGISLSDIAEANLVKVAKRRPSEWKAGGGEEIFPALAMAGDAATKAPIDLLDAAIADIRANMLKVIRALGS